MFSHDTTQASIKYNVKWHFYVSFINNTVLQGKEFDPEFIYYSTSKVSTTHPSKSVNSSVHKNTNTKHV